MIEVCELVCEPEKEGLAFISGVAFAAAQNSPLKHAFAPARISSVPCQFLRARLLYGERVGICLSRCSGLRPESLSISRVADRCCPPPSWLDQSLLPNSMVVI